MKEDGGWELVGGEAEEKMWGVSKHTVVPSCASVAPLTTLRSDRVTTRRSTSVANPKPRSAHSRIAIPESTRSSDSTTKANPHSSQRSFLLLPPFWALNQLLLLLLFRPLAALLLQQQQLGPSCCNQARRKEACTDGPTTSNKQADCRDSQTHVDEIAKLDHQRIKLHEKLAASYRHFISNCHHAVRLINTTRRKQLQELHCISLHL